jgi:hypothetical protein
MEGHWPQRGLGPGSDTPGGLGWGACSWAGGGLGGAWGVARLLISVETQLPSSASSEISIPSGREANRPASSRHAPEGWASAPGSAHGATPYRIPTKPIPSQILIRIAEGLQRVTSPRHIFLHKARPNNSLSLNLAKGASEEESRRILALVHRGPMVSCHAGGGIGD